VLEGESPKSYYIASLQCVSLVHHCAKSKRQPNTSNIFEATPELLRWRGF